MEGQQRRGERVDQAELRRVPGEFLWTGVTRVFQVTTVSKLHATLVRSARKAWRRHLDAAWKIPRPSAQVFTRPPPHHHHHPHRQPPSSCA